MRTANIADLRRQFSKFVQWVENGEEVEVCKRNVPVARIIPVRGRRESNKTVLGCGANTVEIRCDLTEPAMPASDWDMLKE